MRNHVLLQLTILLSFACKPALAQNITADSIYFITTKDGASINGTLLEKNEKQISINTRNFGTVTIPRDSIKELQVLTADSYKHGKFFFPNPDASRYFLSPSAIPLKKGEGYFQNTYLFLCSVNYGVTKNISIGGGLDVITPFVQGGGGPILFANVKAGMKVAKNFYASATTIALRAPNFSDDGGNDWNFHLVEDGAITLGNTDNNFTFGVGYGIKDGNLAPGPSLTFSGMARATPRFSLITENWVVPGTTTNYLADGPHTTTKYKALLSYGMRFMSQKIAVDFGFINSGDIAQIIAIGIPYVDFVVKF